MISDIGFLLFPKAGVPPNGLELSRSVDTGNAPLFHGEMTGRAL